MLVFIRMIPKSVTCNELSHFVHRRVDSLRTRFSGNHGSVDSVSIKKFTNQETQSVEYHGVVNIEPAVSAQAAIRRLNRTTLKGVPVEVRKFYHRSPLRDRRKGQSVREYKLFNDLRKRDRRRNQLDIEPVYVSGVIKAGDAIPMMT